ncbi:hypothetical protein XH99_00730 [Bradyrhizobium nanningense]|uniref:Uncharacterized protein n=2 Tax=Bradyrhizobium nanningense TaxID=1325118 RepID=A0A4Q0SK04_9BRAD|nr:hypothetical protein XH99_00730 [Bradyrhizobium nanningense]
MYVQPLQGRSTQDHRWAQGLLVHLSRLLRGLSMTKSRSLAALSAVLMLGGCGTYVPAMQEVGENPSALSEFTAGGAFEFKIRAKVYCDIVDAVLAARGAGILPTGWAVQTTFGLAD